MPTEGLSTELAAFASRLVMHNAAGTAAPIVQSGQHDQDSMIARLVMSYGFQSHQGFSRTDKSHDFECGLRAALLCIAEMFVRLDWLKTIGLVVTFLTFLFLLM